MENKFMTKYNYTTTFLYVLYFSFLINHIVNVIHSGSISTVWEMFSISGIYFSIFCIIFYSLKKLVLNFKNKYPPLSKSLPLFNNYTGIFVLIFLILGHYFSKQDILFPIANKISFLLPFHEYFIFFLIGLIFFILGLFSFKSSNHKVLGVALIIMFLNGLYLGIVWHSFTEQRNLYQDLYSVSIKNEFVLKECQEAKISCFKLKSDSDAKNMPIPHIGEPSVDKAISSYLTNFIDKIANSKQEEISYSYGNSVYQFYNDYKAIGVYNHKNHSGILDYQTLANVEKQSIRVFFNIIGVATFCWLLLLFFLLSTHQYIRYYFSKKDKNQHE